MRVANPNIWEQGRVVMLGFASLSQPMRTSLNLNTAKVVAQLLSFFGAVPGVIDGVYNNIKVKFQLSHTYRKLTVARFLFM